MAAVLWGCISLFVVELYALGLTPLEVVAVRVIFAAVFLFLYLVFVNRKAFAVEMKDSKYFIGTGIFSIVLFNWCFFFAIQETSISVAAILLYTAPAFVLILSKLFFKESLTLVKLCTLLLTFIGCMLVIGILPAASLELSAVGVLAGIGSGFFYALYSIFGKQALKKYSSLTVIFYTFLFASIAIIPMSRLWNSFDIFANGMVWIYGLGLGLFPTALAFIFYTNGLAKVEAGKASIIATLEPVVAAFIGIFVYNELLNLWQSIGVILVIAAVLAVNLKTKQATVKTVKQTLQR